MMHIPMTDLTAQTAFLKDEINPIIQKVIESGRFILGPEVEAFEREMAEYCGTKYAVGVASGTDALTLSLLACGIKPGDEVITTPFTFIANAEAITHCGAKVVFADIDPQTYNIDADHVESAITPRTRSIIPVHLFGQSSEMDDILFLGRKYGIKIIEDCAQALSAMHKGKKVGSIGDAGCLSFFPSKNLGAYGDGGMVITSDQEVAETVKILRQHGAKSTYLHVMNGFNSRLDALQAAILRIKLKKLDAWSELRRQNALFYTRLLKNIEGITAPYIVEHNITSANYYTIRINNINIVRNDLRQYLAAKGIETAIYYPLSLHLQEACKSLNYKIGDFPYSELAQEQVLSFPMYPEISREQMTYVVDNVKEFLNKLEVRMDSFVSHH